MGNIVSDLRTLGDHIFVSVANERIAENKFSTSGRNYGLTSVACPANGRCSARGLGPFT